MNVNQSVPPVPPFGQPQPIYPGYHQSSYGGQSGSTAPAIPYGAYNGPVPGYQQTPPQGCLGLSHLGPHWPLWATSHLCFSPMALPRQVHRWLRSCLECRSAVLWPQPLLLQGWALAHQHRWLQPQEVSLTLVCMAPILRARLLPLARPKVILGSRLPSDLPHHRPPASHPQLQGVLGCLR
ncbi:SEC24 homolog C, COPII coat complex component [Homo sapiens]|uniref:SEC24 homolog C, COPII coat complex component n=1 Tax=Homo sapiens TaxID=9606 RepID=A0A0U1RR58_HUMAN|nr:SEC24-like C, COPII coat complex component [Homo sapiens]KAI4076411.1 SEC24 homolog C, COPII coat complex component [Homo sapiens]